jgi:uncharacterized protein (TIGR02996 family)
VTDDHAAFLRAVVAEPDDDRPRLIFADWLDERGDGLRASFIRWQINGTDGLPDYPAHVTFHQRCAVSNGEHGAESTPGLWWWLKKRMRLNVVRQENFVRSLKPPGVAECECVRGFPTRLACSWESWLAHHAALLDACPIRDARGGLVRLTTWPHIESCGLNSGRVRLADFPDTIAVWVQRLLAAEFPGVRFEPPPARPAGVAGGSGAGDDGDSPGGGGGGSGMDDGTWSAGSDGVGIGMAGGDGGPSDERVGAGGGGSGGGTWGAADPGLSS